MEDNPGDALLLKEALKESSYCDADLFVAGSLAEALTFAEDSMLLLLLDLGLPDSDGLHTVQRIHQHFPDSALIVLTGLDDEQVAIETLREGAQNYLNKNEIEHKILDRTIRFSLERHQIIQKLRIADKELFQRYQDLEQFAYIVSHNLRLPVANIIGLAEILKNDDLNLEHKMEFIDAILTSVKKLDEVVNDLNNVLQIRKEMNEKREWVSFSNLTSLIEESIKRIIDEEQAVIITDFSAIDTIHSLKSYLYSIFYNLITNSIKYKQKDKAPLIQIKSEIKDDKVILYFKDNGSGIDMNKYQDQVFGLYKKFHSKVEGKGLGLYMVKTQVETLGGKISLNSALNQGSEFIIEFEWNHLN